jgi:hypothetical protein
MKDRPCCTSDATLAAALEVDVLDLLAAHTPVTLATLRARLGFTQADVAAELPGMSRSLYAHVEQAPRAAEPGRDGDPRESPGRRPSRKSCASTRRRSTGRWSGADRASLILHVCLRHPAPTSRRHLAHKSADGLTAE